MQNNKKIVTAISVLIFAVLACQATDQHNPQEVPTSSSTDSPSSMEMYLSWRDLWFNTKPGDLGLDLDSNSTIPYAVVMDIGLDNGEAASFASSIVGDGSFFTSTGGGILGSGQQYESVRNASEHFVEVAAEFVSKMEITTEYPLPKTDNLKFYVITPNGVYTADEATWDALGSGNHEFSSLFLAGNDVMTAIRESSGK